MSESPSENMESQSSDAAIEEAIHKLQVESWRKGEEGLQFRVCYLMLELATERDAPNQWKLNKRSIDIDLLDRAMRREVTEISFLSVSRYHIGSKPQNARNLRPKGL